MADAYKGLTIRIGAETDQLTKALASAKKIISSTQGQLTQLNRALKFDPNSTIGVSSKMELLSEKSQAAYARLSTLREALRQIDATALQRVDAGMSGLSAETQEATTRAKYALEQYNRVNHALAEQKDRIQQLAGVDDNFWKQSHSDIENYLTGLTQTGVLTQELVTRYNELYNANRKWSTELEKAKKDQGFQQVIIDIQTTRAEIQKMSNEYMELQTKQARAFMGTDVERYRNQIQQLDVAAEDLKSDFDVLDQALNLSPDTETAKAMFQNLNAQAEISKQKVNALKSELNAMDKANGCKAATADMRNLASETIKAKERASELNQEYLETKGALQEMRNRIETVKAKTGETSQETKKLLEAEKRLTQETAELKSKASQAMREYKDKEALNQQRKLTEQIRLEEAQLKRLREQATGVNNAWKTAFSSFTSIGMTAYATITPVAQAFFDKAITSAQELDGAYRDMRKTVEATEEQYAALKEAAIEFSNTHVTSASQILEIEAMGGQLGIAADSLEEFATTVANLDIATNIDADTVAEQIGQLASIMDIATEDFDNFGDALVRLGNNEPALESNIMDITARIGSQATILGMSADQVLAYSTALAATGQKSEAAGTALSNTMADIEAAVAQGEEGLQGFAEVADMSAEDFAKAWETDAAGALQKFIEGLKRINDEGGSVEWVLQGLEINATRQKQALAGLTQTTDVLSDSLTMSKNAWNGVSDQWGKAGDAAREAEAKSKGFSGALGILENTTANLAAELADGLTPFLFAAGEAMQGLYDIVKDFPDELKVMIVALAGIGIAVGPVLTAVGSIGAYMERAGFLSGTAAGAMREASKHIDKGWSKAAEGAGELVEASSSATGGLQKTGIQAEKSAKKMKLLKSAAKIAAVGIAALAAGALMDFVTQCTNTRKATADLRSTMLNASTTMKGTIPTAAQTAQRSLFDYLNASKQLRTEQAQLSDNIKKSFAEVGSKVSILDQAKDTIKKYGDATNLTSTQVAELKSAVDLVNQEFGTNYKVVSEGNAYKVIGDDAKSARDEILKLIDAQELQMKKNAYMEAWQGAKEQEIKTGNELQAAKNKKKALNDEIDALAADNDFGKNNEAIRYKSEEVAILDANIRSLTESYKAASDATFLAKQAQDVLNLSTGEGASEIAKLIAADDAALNAMNGCSGGALNLIGMFEGAGVKAKDLANVDWTVLATNFDGTYASIAGDLASMGVKLDEGKMKAFDMQQGMAIAFAAVKNDSGLASSQTIKNLEESGVSINQLVDQFSKAGISLEDLGKLSDAELSSLVGMYGKSTDEIKAKFSEMASSVEAEGQTVAECVGQGWDVGLQAYSGKGIEWAKVESESLLNEIRSALGIHSPSQVMMELGQYTTQGFIDGLKANQGEIATVFNQAITQIVADATTHSAEFNQLGFQFMSVLGTAITSNQYLVLDAVSGVFAQCSASVASSGIQDSFYQIGNSSMGSFASGINNGAGAAESAASSAGTRVSGAVKANLADYTTTGMQAMINFAHGIDAASGNPISAGKYAASRAAAETRDTAFSGFHNTGYWAMRGFAAGMDDNRWIARQAAQAAARDAKTAADEAIGVGSPAREFIKTGMWAMKGLAVGIEDNAKLAIRATKSSMDDVVRQAQEIIDRASLSIETTVASDLSGNHVVSVAFDDPESAASTSEVVNIYIDGAIVNDDKQIGMVLKDTLIEYKRKSDM